MDDFTQIRQVAQYPQVTSGLPDDLLLLQRYGLGGPYVSIEVADFLNTALRNAPGSGIGLTYSSEITWSAQWPPGQSGAPAPYRLSAGATGRPGFAFNAPAWFDNGDVTVRGSVHALGVYSGGFPVATIAYVTDKLAWWGEHSVHSFNGRHGEVCLQRDDILHAGGVSALDARMQGTCLAPTFWNATDASDIIATDAFVQKAISTALDTFLPPPSTQFVSIKDFGAKGDGVTNDTAAFLAFNAWAVTQTTGVYLLIPPGHYAGLLPTLVGATQPRGGADFYRGISDLTISAYGATLDNIYRLGPLMVSQTIPETTSARLNAVPLGATSVTLQNVADAAHFAVGNWVMVSSLEMQGQQGFPPNWYYFDYAQISAIAGTTVTFTHPLFFSHKSTYPQTVLPANVPTVGFDCGGPASMFLLLQDWNQSVKIMGMTVLGTGGYQAGFTAKRFELVDCYFPGTAGAMVSNCMEAIFQRCDMGPTFQPDKLNSLIRMDNCQIPRLHLTSSSNDKFWLDGCNISTIDAGIMKSTRITNSNIENFQITSCAFGAVQSLRLGTCQIGPVTFVITAQSILLSLLTFTNGTFSMPLTQTVTNLQNVYRFAIPGSKCFFGATGNSTFNYGNPFIITAVYQDTTNVYFDTTLTALPTYTGGPGGPNSLVQHPCPRLTATHITGSEMAIQLGKAPPGLPIYSYAHKVYGGDLTNAVASIIPIRQWGTFVSLKVNVIRADTGANVTLMLNVLGQFGVWVANTSNAISQYNPRVDLKTAGLRTVTPAAVTGSAGADVLGAAPGTIWFIQNGIWPLLSLSITGDAPAQMPIVEIELITDQGITTLEYNAL